MVITSMSQKVAFPHSVAEIEAMAVVKALEFSAEIRITEAIMEGDSRVYSEFSKSKGSIPILVRLSKYMMLVYLQNPFGILASQVDAFRELRQKLI